MAKVSEYGLRVFRILQDTESLFYVPQTANLSTVKCNALALFYSPQDRINKGFFAVALSRFERWQGFYITGGKTV